MDGQHRFADCDLLLRVDRADGAANHEAHQLVFVRIGWDLGDERAIAQHADGLCNARQLLQVVADKDHGHALGLELLKHGKEGIDLLTGERGRGLIQDKNSRVHGQRLGDFYELLFGHTQLTHRLATEVPVAAAQGYAPDNLVCADDLPEGAEDKAFVATAGEGA